MPVKRKCDLISFLDKQEDGINEGLSITIDPGGGNHITIKDPSIANDVLGFIARGFNNAKYRDQVKDLDKILKSRKNLSKMYRKEMTRSLHDYVQNEIIQGRKETKKYVLSFVGRVLSPTGLFPTAQEFEAIEGLSLEYESYDEYLRQTIKALI